MAGWEEVFNRVFGRVTTVVQAAEECGFGSFFLYPNDSVVFQIEQFFQIELVFLKEVGPANVKVWSCCPCSDGE